MNRHVGDRASTSESADYSNRPSIPSVNIPAIPRPLDAPQVLDRTETCGSTTGLETDPVGGGEGARMTTLDELRQRIDAVGRRHRRPTESARRGRRRDRQTEERQRLRRLRSRSRKGDPGSHLQAVHRTACRIRIAVGDLPRAHVGLLRIGATAARRVSGSQGLLLP